MYAELDLVRFAKQKAPEKLIPIFFLLLNLPVHQVFICDDHHDYTHFKGIWLNFHMKQVSSSGSVISNYLF